MLQHLEMADKYGLTDLQNLIYNFLRERFSEIAKSPQFTLLSADRMMCLLSDGNLVVSGGELTIFQVRKLKYSLSREI